MRRAFAIGSLITILLTGVFGICQMSGVNESDQCHRSSESCPFSFEEQLAFLSHVTVSTTFPFLAFVFFVAICFLFVLRCKFYIYHLKQWRLRHHALFLFQTSLGLTPLAFAFSQGICHPKKD